jgi:hypothetical protein
MGRQDDQVASDMAMIRPFWPRKPLTSTLRTIALSTQGGGFAPLEPSTEETGKGAARPAVWITTLERLGRLLVSSPYVPHRHAAYDRVKNFR